MTPIVGAPFTGAVPPRLLRRPSETLRTDADVTVANPLLRRTAAFQADSAGSIPVTRSTRKALIRTRVPSAERKPRIEALFASREVEAALDLLHLTDMAWHDLFH
ncbi:hypothetical protein [Micromonospora sp. URMC 103]|uniref:hypothetical protein n=1 Tax=Micromonospora sp. URMC 103 TaxID=3423406 RepID=UPI003F1C6116